ncbi:lysostaphin resistance A-like protein [Mycobacterium sp. pUA109]|uniref:lysostaphin resistance A-like protein n=1 Tax=Mycobacterium sp. pUA109 TaxID=3238982 RepID=UPI00351ADD7C
MTQSTPAHPGLVHEFIEIITNVAVPHHEAPRTVLRRRAVVAVVLVIGTIVLGYALTRRPGDSAFYWLTLALAAVWFVGALVSGPLHLGCVRFRGRNERPVFTGTGIGLVLGTVFVVGGMVARQIPAVSEPVQRVLVFADRGTLSLLVLITVANAVAEEMFFRGALYTAIGRYHPVAVSTLLYVAVTLASANPMLGFAALILGTVCAIERRATGGVLAPILTHLVWGLIMVLALPPVFGT